MGEINCRCHVIQPIPSCCSFTTSLLKAVMPGKIKSPNVEALVSVVIMLAVFLNLFSLCDQIRKMKMSGRENRIAVVVGTVTDDVRIQDIPKLKVTPPL